MAETPNTFASNPPLLPKRGVMEVIVSSATEAFGSAFTLWILGGIAISIASAFTGDMIPSLPPGFGASEAAAKHHHAFHFHAWWRTLHGNAFAFFFAVFFIHSLWHNFHSASVGPARRVRRILSRLREDWFSLIVTNAITAWVAALVMGMIPDFSLWHMVGHWLWETIAPSVAGAGQSVVGSSTATAFADWASWFGDNQSKLTFWIVFFAGAFDDLGVPNYKTLWRWTWHYCEKQNKPSSVPANRQTEPIDPV